MVASALRLQMQKQAKSHLYTLVRTGVIKSVSITAFSTSASRRKSMKSFSVSRYFKNHLTPNQFISIRKNSSVNIVKYYELLYTNLTQLKGIETFLDRNKMC